VFLTLNQKNRTNKSYLQEHALAVDLIYSRCL